MCRECPQPADVTVDGTPLCADCLHVRYPAEVEAGHADRISGLVFLD